MTTTRVFKRDSAEYYFREAEAEFVLAEAEYKFWFQYVGNLPNDIKPTDPISRIAGQKVMDLLRNIQWKKQRWEQEKKTRKEDHNESFRHSLVELRKRNRDDLLNETLALKKINKLPEDMVRLIAGFSTAVQIEQQKVKQEYLVCFLKDKTRGITESFFQGQWKKEKTGRLLSHINKNKEYLVGGKEYKKFTNDYMLNRIAENFHKGAFASWAIGSGVASPTELLHQKQFTKTLFAKYAILYSCWKDEKKEYLAAMKKFYKKNGGDTRPLMEFYHDFTNDFVKVWWDRRERNNLVSIAQKGFELYACC
jgi:hypothetical protein